MRGVILAALAATVLWGFLHLIDKIAQGLEARCDVAMPSGD